MSGALEFVILGCGYSGGVPRADGDWGACDPAEPRNRRSRCSLLVRRKAETEGAPETTVLIDTSPDLHGQCVRAGVRRMDAVLYTHDHADQSHGIDDLRVFYLRSGRPIPCYMDPATTATLRRRFDYVFDGRGGYPAICEARPLPPFGERFELNGPSGPVPIVAYDQDHGGVRSVGYRLGPVAYSSDVVELPPESLETLRGVEVLIVDALRERPHPTHAHVARALEWIEMLQPRRALLTNLHAELDYRALARRLPSGVEPAYDGLSFRAGF